LQTNLFGGDANVPELSRGVRGTRKALTEGGDAKGAIEIYRRAQEITPMPDYAAALYDLYKKSGNGAEAAKQMELLEVIDRVSGRAVKKPTGILSSRSRIMT